MNSKLPLITVIIPTYNSAKTLERCLASVLHQTYSNLEIILIDDGSTDQTPVICDQLAQQDRRIKVVHQSNQGLSAARNAGLEIMRGDFVTFVDSDDAIATDLIERLYQALVQHQVPLAACDFQTIKGNATPVSSPDAGSAKIYAQTDALIAMLCEQIPIMACGKLYAKEFFKTVRFPVSKLYEDVGTTYKLILQCENLVYLPVKDYFYYQSSDSIIHQTFRPQKMDLIALTDEMCNTLSIHCHDNVLQDAIRLRRCHARFSILRQLVLAKPQTPEIRELRSKMVSYLKQHKDDVLSNHLSSKRDRFAMRTLLLGVPIFTLAWKIYAKLR